MLGAVLLTVTVTFVVVMMFLWYCFILCWFCLSHVMSTVILGDYCVGVPPLPIPNREVKPVCADGTAMRCGRVGGCPFSYIGSVVL